MAQLSRPYQIGLLAVALLAAAWLLLFQGHHGSSSGSGSSQPPATTTPAAKAPTTAPKAHAEGTAGQATGHGSASSLGAFGHAIEKARGAATTSQHNTQELERKSAQASSASAPAASTPPAPTTTTPAPATPAKSAAPSTTASAPAATKAPSTGTSSAKGTVRAAVALRQHAVEAQLAQGKTVLIFFWNPKGSDDRAVNSELARLPHNLHIAVDRANANAVTTFGTITRGIQVYGTPTLLVVNKKGQVTTLTGLQSSFTIAQTIEESKKQ